MGIRFYKNKRIRNIVLSLVGLTAAIASIVVVVSFINQTNNPLPENIKKTITFSPFVIPLDSQNLKTNNYKFETAEGKTQILTYVIETTDAEITVTEYTQPPEFTEIAEYKNQFLANVINQYETVQTSNGTVYLGRLELQNNKQVAVLIERGLIVFMNPNKDLNAADWRRVGDSLEIQKID